MAEKESMVDDLWKDIKEHVKHRLSNPLLSAIAWSWLVWNYKIVFTLITMRPIKEAFNYIDGVLTVWGWEYVIHCYLGPLGSGLFYIYAVPVLTRHASEYTLRRKQKEKEMRKSIEGLTLLTYDEAKAIEERVEIVERENRELNATVRSRDREIEKLNVQLGNIDLDERTWISLTEDQKKILQMVSGKGKGDSIIIHDIERSIKKPRVDILRDIDELTSINAIEEHGESEYRGTAKGRSLLPKT